MNLLKTKKWMSVLLILGSVILFSNFVEPLSDEEWVVPENFKNMKNPIAADEESLEIGGEIYAKHCKSCHGKTGEGDGTKAEELDDFPGDFTEEEFASQTDGSLFYKTKEGRDDMPGFSKKIPDDEDIWHVVNYMRDFAN